MTEISERYRRLSDQFAARIAAVPDDRWTSQSPCAGWTALDVVRHVVDSQGMFLGFVDRKMGPLPHVAEDPGGAWDAARAAVQADLDDPGRARAEFDGYFGRRSFAQAIDNMINFDLIVHGWDLARATGQDERIEPEDVRHAIAAAHSFGDNLRRQGVCGPEVPVPPDADEQTRMLAFLGRRA